MSNFTLKNFKTDVTDFAGERGLGPDLEFRMARSEMDSEDLGVSYVRHGAGFRAPYGHHHVSQEEAYVVVSGSGRVKLDDEILELAQWDVLRVAPAVVRAFEAGPDGLEMVAIGGPRPTDGDGEMISEWWTD